MKTHNPLRIKILSCFLLLFIAGCDNGDGSGPDGNATVQGNVSSFTINGMSFLPPGNGGFFSAIIDVFIPRARAAISGVGVRMTGTDLSTTTDENGYFIMSGAPSGNHQMQFMFKDQTSTIDVRVPDNGTLTMQDVRCYGQQPATVNHMNVEMNSTMGSVGGMPGHHN